MIIVLCLFHNNHVPKYQYRSSLLVYPLPNTLLFLIHRHMKYDLRHLKALVPARTDGSLFPACFEVIALHTYLSVSSYSSVEM